MRVFIAIDVNEQIKKNLHSLQKEILDKIDIKKTDVKWVEPVAMHLTLKFLGEIKDNEIVGVCKIVEETAKKHECFELAIESVGWFGQQNPSVLWIGTGEGEETLRNLQLDIDEKFMKNDFRADKKKFAGHLTLCRMRSSKAGRKVTQAAEIYKDYQAGQVWIDSVCVYQSQLKADGPVYTVLGKYKLQ